MEAAGSSSHDEIAVVENADRAKPAITEDVRHGKIAMADALKNGRPSFTDQAFGIAADAVETFVQDIVSTARSDANKRKHEMVLNEHVARALRTLGRTKRVYPLLSQLSNWMAGVGGGLLAPWAVLSTPPVGSLQIGIGAALMILGLVGMVAFR